MVGAQTLGHTVRMGDLQKGLFAPSHLSTQNDWFTFQAKGIRESTPITGEMISLSQCPQNLYLLPSRELASALCRASKAQGIALNSARPETLSLVKGEQLQNSKASSCWTKSLDVLPGSPGAPRSRGAGLEMEGPGFEGLLSLSKWMTWDTSPQNCQSANQDSSSREGEPRCL